MFSLSCYSKVWHVRWSGKEYFESKNVQILVMKCVSEMQFMQILLFDWQYLICHHLLQTIVLWCEKYRCGIYRRHNPGNRIPSHYHKCSLVSKGESLWLFKSIRNWQSHTAMPVLFSMVGYLQTLTDSKQNYSRNLKKINIMFFGIVLVGTYFAFLWRHQDL